MTSKRFLLCQRMCVGEEVTLLSNSISGNLTRIMLCLRVMANLAEIFERKVITKEPAA